MTESVPLLEVHDLHIDFTARRGRGVVQAVDGVSLHLDRGETLGLVGESGSGKSTVGNAILGLVPVTSGRVAFLGQDITHLPPGRRGDLTRRLQVVFQDPYSSLNPSRTVGDTLSEPLRAHHRLRRTEARDRVATVLNRVGLSTDVASRYPAHFSGGQRQRIAIARALVLDPEVVICDEPTSALDLSVQAQILNLLLELQETLGLAYLFISHDIDVVRHLSHRVAVMRAGHIVEQGPADRVTSNPRHPYTQALLEAAPVPDPAEQSSRRNRRGSACSNQTTSQREDLLVPGTAKTTV